MRELLKHILAVQTVTYNSFRMFAFIIRFAAKHNISYFVSDGSIYLQKGEGFDGYPCIVSHIDTVHDITDSLTVMDCDGVLFGYDSVNRAPVGIGGDDKVGIFIALQMFLDTDNLKAVFFRDEESGCEGSYSAHKPFFSDVNFALQFDRKGNTDFVTNAAGVELSGKDFQKGIKGIVLEHRYNFYKHGGLTDVCALKSLGINIAMANISCGYYNPHEETEYVVIKDVLNAYNMGLAICTAIKVLQPHKVAYKAVDYGYKSSNYYSYKPTNVSNSSGTIGGYDNYKAGTKEASYKTYGYGWNKWDTDKISNECECCLNISDRLTECDGFKLCLPCAHDLKDRI